MSFFLREAWDEFRFGMGNGIVVLIYVVLVGYLLLVLANADYLRDMGAADIPRNAPSLVYLMTSGISFFLFFVWAWVFAQPIVRDRTAQLHEVVLAAPISLRRLLAARYVGALGVGLVVGSSQVVGFLVAPVLEWMGAIPRGSLAPMPWLAFGWATLIFTLPLAAGTGALYFIAAVRTRGVGGPFAVAAALMACWMVAMIVLKDGHFDQSYVTILDPSAYAEAEHQVVDNWTPHEKRTALLALSPALLWNRLIWGGLPLVLLGIVLWRVRREWLVLESVPKSPASKGVAAGRITESVFPVGPIRANAWWRAAVSESLWQTRQFFERRWMWVTLAMLVLLGVAGAYVHVVQHAYGPLTPRPELVTPLLAKMFLLIIVFMITGLVGVAARRDEQPGMSEIFDAAPAPCFVRLVGRSLAAMTITVVLAVLAGVSGILTTLFIAPQHVRLLQPLIYQLTAITPALLEIAAATILLHALIRRPGPAYAASVLASFIMIVNHEAELITYPPLQIGLPVVIGFSGLTGLTPWVEKLALMDGFKLSLVVVLLALSVMVARRGTDTGPHIRWRMFRNRLLGGAGVVAVTASVSLGIFAMFLHQRYVVEGGYETLEQELAGNAEWETRWLDRQGAFSIAGGRVELEVDPDSRVLTGFWRLHGVLADGSELHATLPHGLELTSARVGGREVEAVVEHDHLALPLGLCPETGCDVELSWFISARGLDTERRPAWLLRHAYWLHAPEVMPRLGFDADRVLRVPFDRERFGLPEEVRLPRYHAALPSGAAAPSGHWTWRVTVKGDGRARHVREGEIHGLLDFADVWAPSAVSASHGGVTLMHDPSRSDTAVAVAEDLADMRACVARRLGQSPSVEVVSQWPRELGDSVLTGSWLLLAENPHWDVADQGISMGTGRWVRRAEIAAALARRVVRDAADLRQGEGAIWLNNGLPGAVGLLCVAETDGLEALGVLLSKGADQVAQAIAASATPVGPLRYAETDGWAVDYAPLAALDWTSRLTPGDIASLLRQARMGGDIGAALASLAGKHLADQMLGAPNASDVRVSVTGSRTLVSGERWQWENGGWIPADSLSEPWRYRAKGGRLVIVPTETNDALDPAESVALFLDAWSSYERAPKDNSM
ncbi:ABC transporter permease family protein [Desulfonatronum thiodismutans]|uniref:ABC transporter permease n=1 Tax=Desulfonatronum thiodismutans TaxID=159290 RepID=UPI0004ABD99B|nr:ABC transporter permease [Desulfonatronum thiodismutans]